jgi:hypothetical protein
MSESGKLAISQNLGIWGFGEIWDFPDFPQLVPAGLSRGAFNKCIFLRFFDPSDLRNPPSLNNRVLEMNMRVSPPSQPGYDSIRVNRGGPKNHNFAPVDRQFWPMDGSHFSLARFRDFQDLAPGPKSPNPPNPQIREIRDSGKSGILGIWQIWDSGKSGNLGNLRFGQSGIPEI